MLRSPFHRLILFMDCLLHFSSPLPFITVFGVYAAHGLTPFRFLTPLFLNDYDFFLPLFFSPPALLQDFFHPNVANRQFPNRVFSLPLNETLEPPAFFPHIWPANQARLSDSPPPLSHPLAKKSAFPAFLCPSYLAQSCSIFFYRLAFFLLISPIWSHPFYLRRCLTPESFESTIKLPPLSLHGFPGNLAYFKNPVPSLFMLVFSVSLRRL